MFLEGADKAGGQHGDPIPHAFATPHNDLMWREIEVFHAEPKTFHQL
jgi:hypothetical protein